MIKAMEGCRWCQPGSDLRTVLSPRVGCPHCCRDGERARGTPGAWARARVMQVPVQLSEDARKLPRWQFCWERASFGVFVMIRN